MGTSCSGNSAPEEPAEEGRAPAVREQEQTGVCRKGHVGHVCRSGRQPGGLKRNQDCLCVESLPGRRTMYGVFDGHGENGHCVASYVKQSLARSIRRRRDPQEDLPAMLSDSFRRVQADLRRSPHLGSRWSGTTATVVLHDHRSDCLTVSHVGDSMAILVRQSPGADRGVVAVPLTRDHDPSLPEERRRIESAGAVVLQEHGFCRVYQKQSRRPGLNLSRTLGDTVAHIKCGVTAEPEVSTHQLCADDQRLLVCSDGIWSVIRPQEAADIVSAFGPNAGLAAARALADAAMALWLASTDGVQADDISVALAFLQGGCSACALDSDSSRSSSSASD